MQLSIWDKMYRILYREKQREKGTVKNQKHLRNSNNTRAFIFCTSYKIEPTEQGGGLFWGVHKEHMISSLAPTTELTLDSSLRDTH